VNRTLLAAAWPLLLACAASAQATDQPDPLDPAAVVDPVRHQSAFQGFRTHGDPTVGDWRAVNETVGRIGGWRTYAREVAEGAADAEREAAAHQAGAAPAPRGPDQSPAALREPAPPQTPPADAHRHPGAGR